MDREKVIKGLYACTTFGEDGVTDGDCKICPYDKGYATGECWVQMNRDALSLLKEQEAEIRQLRLALDIAKGTCKGIKIEDR